MPSFYHIAGGGMGGSSGFYLPWFDAWAMDSSYAWQEIAVAACGISPIEGMAFLDEDGDRIVAVREYYESCGQTESVGQKWLLSQFRNHRTM